MKNNEIRLKVLIMVFLIVLVSMVIAVTYAVYEYTKEGEEENFMTTGTMTMVYNEDPMGINLQNIGPMTDEDGKNLSGEGNEFNFSVEIGITGKQAIFHEVTMAKLEGSTIPDQNVRVYLERKTNNGNYEAILGPTSFSSLDDEFEGEYEIFDDVYVIGEKVIDRVNSSRTAVYSYKLRAWIDNNYIISSNSDNFYFTVNLYGDDGVYSDE